MSSLWSSTLRLCCLLLLAPACANAQQTPNAIAIAPLVGNWDLPGTLTRLKIHPDGTVDHSKFGEGTIQYQEATYFRLFFREPYLTCTYDVRKYSENEITFTILVHPSDSACELGALRKSPAPQAPPDATKSKGSEAPGAATVADKSNPPPPGTVLKDCDDCPELVVVPAGRFAMGSPDSELGRDKDEGPQRTVEVSSFAVGRYAITRDQFDEFVKATGGLYADGCYVESAKETWDLHAELSFRSPGFPQDGRHPAVCVSWEDAQAYVKWLSARTGKSYRLLTEAEREYVTRAGKSLPYWWGATVRPDQANYFQGQPAANANGASKARVASTAVSKVPPPQITPASTGTVPVNLYQPNPWGLFQVHGNVAEWVEDCWNANYEGAPLNASAVRTGDCSRHVLRGGGWSFSAQEIRSAFRDLSIRDRRYVHVGFRVARDLT
jgi:formylglycine-generating enzyme required for sulfatase activity